MFIPSLELKHKILNNFTNIPFQKDEISYEHDPYYRYEYITIYANELELVNEITSWFKTNEKINIGKYKGIFPQEMIIPRKIRFSVDLINEEDSFLDWFKDDNYNINGD